MAPVAEDVAFRWAVGYEEQMGGEFWEAIKWPLLAAAGLLAHFAVALLAMSLIWVGQQWVNFLWGAQEPLLFDVVPLKWLFDVIDLVILVIFLYHGGLSANATLSKR